MVIKVILVTQKDKIPADMTPFKEVIGQNSIVGQIAFYVKSHNSGIPIPSLILTGSHGLGKTYMASKIAEALHRKFVVINAKTMETTKDFIEGVLLNSSMIFGDDPVTVLIDEAHGLTKEVATLLLTILNPNDSHINNLMYKNATLQYDMSRVNVIFATTDAYNMIGPLRNRCESLYFEPYSDSELIDILKYYLSDDIKIRCDEKDLAGACRGRARDAYQLAQKIHRFLDMKYKKFLDPNGWNELKGVFGIQRCGLTKVERDVLIYIEKHQPVSCYTLSTAFMTGEENVKLELEVRLRELGFIDNTSRGRIITEVGKQYLQEELVESPV